MDNLMGMCRKERINDYFKNYAIKQIEVGYRILEYLEPDSYFPPKNIDKHVMELFLQRDIGKAVHLIVYDIDPDGNYGDLEKEANVFAKSVLEDYFDRINKSKLSERERLLIRLGELNSELN